MKIGIVVYNLCTVSILWYRTHSVVIKFPSDIFFFTLWFRSLTLREGYRLRMYKNRMLEENI